MENNENTARFFGSGWQFPPTFSSSGHHIGTVTREAAVHQSLRILLTTYLGERSLNSRYGSGLFEFQFGELTQQLLTGIRKAIEDALLRNEPRVRLDRVTIQEDPLQQGLLIIEVNYTIKATNSRFNLVYPYYLNEGNLPPS